VKTKKQVRIQYHRWCKKYGYHRDKFSLLSFFNHKYRAKSENDNYFVSYDNHWYMLSGLLDDFTKPIKYKTKKHKIRLKLDN